MKFTEWFGRHVCAIGIAIGLYDCACAVMELLIRGYGKAMFSGLSAMYMFWSVGRRWWE